MTGMQKKTWLRVLAVTTATILTVAGCSSSRQKQEKQAREAAVEREKEVAAREGATVISRIAFPKGTSVLDDRGKEELSRAIARARKMGDVSKVTVAVWSDMEFPTQKAKVPQRQVQLANRRGEQIESYLEDRLEVRDVRVHNMGEHESWVTQAMDTPDARLKKQLLETGVAAPKGTDKVGVRKASTALVMIEVQ
jgi:hypothetical protein